MDVLVGLGRLTLLLKQAAKQRQRDESWTPYPESRDQSALSIWPAIISGKLSAAHAQKVCPLWPRFEPTNLQQTCRVRYSLQVVQ